MSTMIESLAQTRHAERYSRSRRATETRPDVSSRQNPRSRAGWLLVGLGLRLALPGGQAGAHRATLTGR